MSALTGMEERVMRGFGKFCIILGILLGFAAGAWYLCNEIDEQRAQHEAEIAMTEVQIAVENARRNEIRRDGSANRVIDEMQYIEVDGNRYIGYIHVPELNLSLPVQADWDMDKLKISPCRYSGSIVGGNLIIAGHNYKAHFSPLKTLREGAEIVFEDVQGKKITYTVSQILEIDGNDAQTMLGNSDSWDLTLFTCNYGGKKRVTLRCVQSA